MLSLLRIEKKYISKYFWNRPNMFKFVELINSSNNSCIRKCEIVKMSEGDVSEQTGSFSGANLDNRGNNIRPHKLHTLCKRMMRGLFMHPRQF